MPSTAMNAANTTVVASAAAEVVGRDPDTISPCGRGRRAQPTRPPRRYRKLNASLWTTYKSRAAESSRRSAPRTTSGSLVVQNGGSDARRNPP
ncbi:hypothetical protein GCM10023222_26790 [Saccharopolyspora cebuensis]